MSTSTDRQPLRVAIIGAGAAGLFASHRLRIALGSRVQIQHFEADSRCGGRVYSVRDAEFADYAVEMGAEEVHGEKSLMYRLASSCPGAEIVDRDKLLDDFYWLDGKLIDENQAYKDKDIKKLENMDDWMWTYKGADMSVADAAKQRQISQRINTFFEMEFGTEYGTDNSNLSIVYKQEVDRSWRAGEKNFVLKGASMMDVIQHTVGAEVMSSVQLNHSVSHVTFTDDKQVVVRGINSSDNSPFECIVDKVFITVSLGVLQARAIQFQPALPEALQSTIDRQGFDAGIKVTLKFNRRFWPKYMASCYGTNLIREFWACGAGKGTNSHLTGFVMGQNAKSLSERGTAGIIDAALDELSIIFGDAPRECYQSALVKDWYSDPLHRGAYSYPKIDCGGLAARKQLAEPQFDGRLFLCGEAITCAHPATAFGAMESAQAAVAAMQAGLSN